MAGKQFFMGLDIGTSGVKAVIFDDYGNPLSIAQQEYHFFNPKPGWSEIDPEEVWRKTVTSIRECTLQSTISPKQISAIGLSVLGETTLPMDEKGHPLYQAIDSQDKRFHGYQPYLDWFDAHFGAEEIYKRTSYSLAFIAPALRLLWFQEHRPDIFKKIYKFVTFQDFTLWRLAGKPVIDYSMASRTLLFDVQQKTWIKEYLQKMNVPINMLSDAKPSSSIVGQLTDHATKELGLFGDTLVITGAHDQSCASLGIGGITEGIASDGTGSVEAIATPTKKPFISPGLHKKGFTSECHLKDDLYLALGYHLTAGSLVRWYRDQLGKWEKDMAERDNTSVYDMITQAAQKSPPGAHGLLVLPHWSGAGTGHSPMLNPSSRGAILGLTLSHDKSDLDRAIFEGITFEARLIVESFEESNIPIDAFMVTGGGAKSAFWMQLKADIIGKPMKIPQTSEASAMGGAMLAAVGSGRFANFEEAAGNFCRTAKTYHPDPNNTKKYDQIFPLYRNLYDAVIDINTQLSAMDFSGNAK
ncbi:MAG: FGGY family carbohydrate kinase [Anaerolineaceae bacterium]|nr:FGGY family carbohydrate kinase [Anaerolineaceae bacterium]